jgi:hypothetical protein
LERLDAPLQEKRHELHPRQCTANAKLTWNMQLMVLVRGEQPAHWEPQEEGMMSIAASFPSVKKPRYVDLGEKGQ